MNASVEAACSEVRLFLKACKSSFRTVTRALVDLAGKLSGGSAGTLAQAGKVDEVAAIFDGFTYQKFLGTSGLAHDLRLRNTRKL